jgi:hypothetical protein
MRRAVVYHMRLNMGVKVVDDISNWWSTSWAAFMEKLCPAFLILHDGEDLVSQTQVLKVDSQLGRLSVLILRSLFY